ncbi:DALR anticodon-binding domain-containing protein 3 [Holothuria leucospilota]|uniref:DALR anticodon-binding domain-containing protein 3 n=1 Tax=Holothuria leucospilota TaxID=206669 RepID=A0A9Q1CK28_HOLLE|nr:DALR anticodon-binding domain-containing protein 3 [Holothuria leucospilota]
MAATISTEVYQFRSKLIAHLRKSCGEHHFLDNITNVRIHRQQSVADFIIPAKCVRSFLSDNSVISSSITAIPNLSQDWPIRVAEATLDSKSGILLKLDRSCTFQKTLTRHLSLGTKVFYQGSGKPVPPVLILSGCRCKAESNNVNLEKRNQLRCELVAHHLKSVCKLFGAEVKLVNIPGKDLSPTVCRLTGRGEVLYQSDDNHKTSAESRQSIMENFRRSLKKHLEIQKTKKMDRSEQNIPSKSATQSCQKGSFISENTSASIDLRHVLDSQKLLVGKRGYSSNLAEVEVLTSTGSPCNTLQQCVELEEAAADIAEDSIPVVVHISVPSQSFLQQKVDLLWRTLSEKSERFQQVHTTIGPVSLSDTHGGGSDVGDVESIVALYDAELREASAVKYGDDIQELETEQQRRAVLVKAAITFDILSTALGSTVKLDLSPKTESSESRRGVFVLYNYARLATLFDRFNGEVTKGVYPPLPPLNEVHFDVLREEEEWKLLFCYVMQFPDILRETLGDLYSSTLPFFNPNPHKVSSFLYNLSRDLSVYYSRTHILVEPREHLLPTMYARLYLLKSVMLVMKEGLDLLDIEPLLQM